jgi:quinol monooxygenase YgiN
MPTLPSDSVCSLAPVFAIQPDQVEAFKRLGEAMLQRTQSEPGCLYYGFCYDGTTARCREGYRDAQALLAHLDNVGDLLEQAQAIATLERFEVFGAANQLEQLREPLAALNARFFVMAEGFRR